MTYTVIREPTAISFATKFLTDDPEGWPMRSRS